MKKFLLSLFAMAFFVVGANSAFAGDCVKREAVNWHATISSAVFLRSDCPQGDVVGTVSAGEVVQILEVDGYREFYLIKTSVGTGFVFSSFLKDIVEAPLPGTETYPNSIFIDLDPNHKYYDEIAIVKDAGIVNGNSDGTIKADNPVNRAELAKILVEATTGSNAIAAASLPQGVYSDVESGAWYLPYLQLAREITFMVGDNAGATGVTTVRPGESANGAEVAKMIAVAVRMPIPALQDGEQWYEPYMNELKKFDALPYSTPGHIVTRGEMMFMVSKLMPYLTINQ